MVGAARGRGSARACRGDALTPASRVAPVTGRRDCYAVVAPGLEAVTAAELRALRIEPGEAEPGGVPFSANDERLFAANLWLRSASRIIVRIAQFRVTAFRDLERLSLGVSWERFVVPNGTARLRVTCRKSKLYHSDGVAQRVAGAIARRVKGAAVDGAARDDTDDATDDAAQLFVVRLAHDVCTISVDSSGDLLHRRGYRLAAAKAPVRETLGAAALLALDWDGTTPLVDPMCGAGTLAIEGALIARRIAPGASRTFACERWPSAPRAKFEAMREEVRSHALPRAPAPILASDRDAGAIVAARANAQRAGVAADIEFREAPLSAMAPPAGPGLLLTNPPYGARVGEKTALRNLYAQLGNVARARCAGWTLAYIAADRALDAQVKLPLDDVLRFRNGGIPVRLVRAQVPGHVRASAVR
jgi:putative N6-adenine-specific DNA methylase